MHLSVFASCPVFIFLLATSFAVFAPLCAVASEASAEEVVLENELLRVTVSPIGARVLSLVDKTSGFENAKVYPHVGGLGEVRFGQELNVSDTETRYQLAKEKHPDGGWVCIATALSEPTDERPYAATVTKTIYLPPHASRIEFGLSVQNTGEELIVIMPWMRHLLQRGTAEMPEETYMLWTGVHRWGLPTLDRPQIMANADRHWFPAGNWTSRVVMPMDESSNTLATVLRPQDMLKIYNWHKPTEDFSTQEVIAAPMFIETGLTEEWNYQVVLAPPMRGVVYASPRLLVGADPFPTGIASDTEVLNLTVAAPEAVESLTAVAELLHIGQPGAVLATHRLEYGSLQAGDSETRPLPIKLEKDQDYQLRLRFESIGQPFHPGEGVDDTEPIIVPLVTDSPLNDQRVFPKRGGGADRLLQVEPRQLKAPLLTKGHGLGVFAFDASSRTFSQDTFADSAEDAYELFASRNEYVSLHLVLQPDSPTDTTIAIDASELAGQGGSKVTCESVNRFLTATNKMPSIYNARYAVGTYREALLPTDQVQLTSDQRSVPIYITYRVPEDATPGQHTGEVRLRINGETLVVPVRLNVWNATLPTIHPWLDTPSSLKGLGTGGVTIRNGDGDEMSRKQLADAVEDFHLRYRLTPCDGDLPGLLLGHRFDLFDEKMQSFLDRGATKIFLGNIQTVLKRYREQIPGVEQHLKEKGWFDHVYVRAGFDEASPDKIPEMRKVAMEWKALSSIPVMETYYLHKPEELYGAIDIYARTVSDDPWIRERFDAGDGFWRVNLMPNHLEREPWVVRQGYIQLWDYRFTGVYLWTAKAWQWVNDWNGGDYWSDAGVGTLCAVLMWPHETGILSTLRLETLRDAIEDNLTLWMLREKLDAVAGGPSHNEEQSAAVARAAALIETPRTPREFVTVDDMNQFRQDAGQALSDLNTLFADQN